MIVSGTAMTDDSIEQSAEDITYRTSSNNMLCLVDYVPLSKDEQSLVDELFKVA